ncbi:LysM peptidoglycan-binding domain-containing protein [Streptomyces halstedii]|uniref:LysM peptidoglycan-binding domain-containing protein n=1 Tax=Streptomyces halstedii TaxID=1944 RepID=A0ABS6U138_STRHA|nr:LysM peptidoglycan-binding domain-containing protein [Streptomyces halstedii]MBV7674263.1 LysM peptidoglycan-binding domain-containing protein [Streptomyces halstedii]
MAHRTPAPLRATGAVLRALLGLAVLVALVVGAPYLLLAVGHPPTELTGGTDLLMQQDDGSLFLVVLTCLGWAGWAAFTLSTLIELVAVLRRRSAPRIKGLGGLQFMAGFLIGGIVLLAPTAASAATVGPAVAATAVQTTSETGSDTAPSVQASDASSWPEHTVSSATELPWDLAEEYLGDGTRWKDIAALNPDIPQLASGDQFLPEGTVVKLPADARPTAPATKTPSVEVAAPQDAQKSPASHQEEDDASSNAGNAKQQTSVTVREGDSLWSIAGAHGDPTSWPAIFEENKGEPTPVGIFDNPNLIYPGQKLDLPQTDTTDEPSTDTAGPSTPQEPDDKQIEPTPAPENTPDRASTETSEPSTSAQALPLAPATSTPSADETRHTPATAPSNNDTALAPAAVWTGAGALAAALVTALATRRILQQRRRRPGRRIPMPTGRTAATEQGLRAAQHPTGFDLLNTALRTLALNLADASRPLPAVEAVVLHDSKIELHLTADTPPMKPFTATAGRQDLWICPASSLDLADEEQLQDADAPYPALVSIGWDNSGRLVLIDLEYIGILNLTGDTDFSRQVLQAIAIELASTPLPGHLEVTVLADTAPGLDAAGPERVARTSNLADAAAELASHAEDQRRAMAAVSASSLRAARLLDAGAGAWAPHILLAEDLRGDDAQIASLFSALTQIPQVAGAVITADASAELPATAWSLDCHGPDHTVSLPGSDLPVHLQGLSDEHFADAVELLTLAASDADVRAPEWTRADASDDQDDVQTEASPADEASSSSADPELEKNGAEHAGDEHEADDGLPAEYAELEEAAYDEAESTEEATNHAQAVNLSKTQDDKDTGRQTAPAAGPSLAEVLAAADTSQGHADAEQSRPAPAAGPTDVTLALTSPCTQPDAPAIHVTIPSPTPAAHTTPDMIDEPATPTRAGRQAAELTPDTAPAVLLLGPIGIEGATGRIDSNRRTAAAELVAFLALNPGVDYHAVDDALWPGRLVNKQMRNAVISRTRSWLGKDTDGHAYLPRVQDTGDSRYRLSSTVTCDWTRFQRLARAGLARHDEDGDLALRRALSLVRGRPFTGIDPQRYAWAEPIIQEMVSAVVDVAYELSTRCREAGDIPGALWAARRGLLSAEESEMLHRQVFLAHHAAGDINALREAAARLVRINELVLGGVDMEAETAELLRNLLPRPKARAR